MLFGKKKIIRHKIFNSVEIAEKRIPLDSAVVIKAGNKTLCLAHLKDGFFAVKNKCPHQGGPLGEGVISDKGEIICPWHKYSFDLKTGKDTGGLGDFVESYPVEISQDGLFISLPQSSWKFFITFFFLLAFTFTINFCV